MRIIVWNKEKILVGVIFCTFVIISWAPTTSNSTLGSDSLRMVMRVMYFVSAMLMAMMTNWKKKISVISILLALTPVVYLCFQNLYSYSGLKGSSSAMLLCALFSLQSNEIQSSVYKRIKQYLLVLAAVGICCYLLYILNIGEFYKLVPYYSGKTGQWYIDYKVCYLYKNPLQTRLCGVFNEPGWFGTFLAFYLCSEKLNFKKLSNIVVGIAGILTFSLAFILIIGIYYVVSKINNLKQWVWVSIIIIFYICILPNVETGNAYVDEMIHRMAITEDGLVGDNRTTASFEYVYKNTINSDSVFWGEGYGYHLVSSSGSVCSIKTYIVDFGILGTAILFLPVFILLMYRYRKNRNVIIFLLCVAASLYQRPWLFETSNFVMTIAATSCIAKEDIYEKEYTNKKI